MIRKLALAISRYLARELDRPESQPVLDYGLQVLLGALFKGAVIFSAAYLLGIFTPTLAVITAAALFRTISGGPHCTSYERCLLASLGVFLVLGYLGQGLDRVLPPYFQMALWSSAFVILMVFVGTWAPGEHPERTFTEGKKRLSRALSSIFLILGWGWAMVSLLSGSGQHLLMPVLLGLTWQGFTITPLGYVFMAKLDHWLTKITPKEVAP